MAVPFLSFPLQLTSTSPILFPKVTLTNQIQFNHKTTTCTPTKPCLRLLRRSAAAGTSVADQTEREGGEVLPNVTPEEEKREEVVEYDWTTEWYPLYLTRDVPEDSPLGLTVFDRQIVLYKDGEGTFRCYEDRCPHRVAKLSEGKLTDGRLECLYHGWQFDGDGKCVKIPQLPANAKIPKVACVKTYEVKDSQGVVWVWMSTKTPPNPEKLPWFEHFDKPGLYDNSSIHEVPYDHSILLENLMDPAHLPISHDRTDFSAKREDAQPLVFRVTERTNRGFAGTWGQEKDGIETNLLRFDAPCVLQNNREFVGKDGVKNYFSGVFLCRPTGQGKCMLITRFGFTKRSLLVQVLPLWFWHQNACKVFEEDMGFLSSQNEVLMKEKVPTNELYINLKSSDTWITEYRKWMDKVGHGMPYYFGHRTISLPKVPPVVDHAPAGLIAGLSASYPAKGGIGTMEAPNLANRYFRHVIHCRSCSKVIKSFELWKNILFGTTVALIALAILVVNRQWKVVLLGSAALCLAAAYVYLRAIKLNTNNFIRKHRRL